MRGVPTSGRGFQLEGRGSNWNEEFQLVRGDPTSGRGFQLEEGDSNLKEEFQQREVPNRVCKFQIECGSSNYRVDVSTGGRGSN